jgi:hypothetical protein
LKNKDERKNTQGQSMHLVGKVKRDVERIGQDWWRVNEVQECVDRDSWRLLCRSPLTCVKMTSERTKRRHDRIHCPPDMEKLIGNFYVNRMTRSTETGTEMQKTQMKIQVKVAHPQK